MTINTQSHKVFLKYAEDHEIKVLSEMHPQKTQIKGFALAMTLYKNNRVNDNKHHRTVKKALELLSANDEAQAIVNIFIERANADINGQTPSESNAQQESDNAPNQADENGANNIAQVVENKTTTKSVIFMDGTIVKAVRKVIPFAELDNYEVCNRNQRNKKALTAASVADILPTARVKGITEEIYTFIREDNQPMIAEGSRRVLTGRIAKIDVPTWEFVEPISDAHVAELSRDSDAAKRKHSLRENALAIELTCKENNLNSMRELLEFYDVTNTDTNRTSYRRILNAATISEDILSFFKDYETLSLRRINELESLQKMALPEETKNAIRLLKRDLNTQEIRELIDQPIKDRIEAISTHFDSILSPMNIARRIADTVATISNTKEELIPRETLFSAIAEHQKPKVDYDPQGRQTNVRSTLTDIMLTYLDLNDEENNPSGVVETKSLKSCIDEYLALYDRDIANVIKAYNDDLFKLVKLTLPLPKSDSDNRDDSSPKKIAETIASNGASKITMSQVTDRKGDVALSFKLKGITEEQKKEFIELASLHFKEKLNVTESPS